MKNENKLRGFSYAKLWQILKCFAGTFHQAQTFKLWGVIYSITTYIVSQMCVLFFWIERHYYCLRITFEIEIATSVCQNSNSNSRDMWWPESSTIALEKNATKKFEFLWLFKSAQKSDKHNTLWIFCLFFKLQVHRPLS